MTLSFRELQAQLQPGWGCEHSGEGGPFDVLVVDDVVTTGATLQAVADALTRGGAARVRAIAAAGVAPRGPLLALGNEAALTRGTVAQLGE